MLSNIITSIYSVFKSNLTLIIYLYGVKWFQLLLCNPNNSIQHQSFVCTRLNDFKYRKWLNISIWPINGTLTGTNTLCQSGPGSNGKEGVLHIPQSFRIGALLPYSLVSYTRTFVRGFLLLCIFYSPSNWAINTSPELSSIFYMRFY